MSLLTLQAGGIDDSLYNALVSFWNLEESNTTRVDQTGNNPLTDINTVPSGVGKILNGASTTSGNNETLTRSDASIVGLSPGFTDFTCCAWINAPALNATQLRPIGTWTVGGSQREWTFQCTSAGSAFVVSRDGGLINVSSGSIAGNIAGAFHFLVGRFSTVTGKADYRIDNGTLATAAASIVSVFQGTSDFNIGFNTGTPPITAVFDAVGFWSRYLTDAECTRLWNSGNGMQYPFS